jgi:lysophospholipase L1-like esterase
MRMPALPSPSRGLPGRRERLLAGASVLISFLLSLAVVEGGLRIKQRLNAWQESRQLPPISARAVIPSPDPELLFEWNPGWSRDGFSVNSLGMADDEVSVAKPEGVFRIAFVGDSLSASFKLGPRSEIYLNALERRLNRDPQQPYRIEALNFGVNGYGLLQDLRVLETRVPPFEPDLIVVQLCLNDPYPSDAEYARVAPRRTLRLWEFLERRLRRDRFSGWFFVDRNYDATGLDNLERGIAGLARLARQGPPILAVLFPYLYRPAYDAWGFERYHALYRRAAAEAGLPLLDLYAPFRRAGLIGMRGVPVDPIHPDRVGNELAAALIASELDTLGWLPRPAAGPAGVTRDW